MMYVFLPATYSKLHAYAFPVAATSVRQVVVPEPIILPKSVTAGTPTRIEIIDPNNGMHIDLPVELGRFDPVKQAWTLSDTKAYFAAPSLLANDAQGTTLIYGHANPDVFGYLNAIKANVGAYALIHTKDKTFRYSYQDAQNAQPDDVSVFRNDGPPTLVVQTCSGDWFQYRRMYRFVYERIEP